MTIQPFSGVAVPITSKIGRNITTNLPEDVLCVIAKLLLKMGEDGNEALENLANTCKKLNEVVRLTVRDEKTSHLIRIMDIANLFHEQLQSPEMLSHKPWIESEIKQLDLRLVQKDGKTLGLSIWQKKPASSLLQAMMIEIQNNLDDENFGKFLASFDVNELPKEVKEIIYLCSGPDNALDVQNNIISVMNSLVILGYNRAEKKLQNDIGITDGDFLRMTFGVLMKKREDKLVWDLLTKFVDSEEIIPDDFEPIFMQFLIEFGLDDIMDRILNVSNQKTQDAIKLFIGNLLQFYGVIGIEDKIKIYYPNTEFGKPFDVELSKFLCKAMTGGTEDELIKAILQIPNESAQITMLLAMARSKKITNHFLEKVCELNFTQDVKNEAHRISIQLNSELGKVKKSVEALRRWKQYTGATAITLDVSADLSILTNHLRNIHDIDSMEWFINEMEELFPSLP